MLSMLPSLNSEDKPHHLITPSIQEGRQGFESNGGDDEYLDVEDHEDENSRSDCKKNSKPIMEKRRRARINHCLAELKSLIVDALNKDPTRHNKLEKADILELTVKHLQEVQKRQLGSAVARDPSVLHKFRNGFAECATEVTRYVNRIESVETGIKTRLVNHLGQCVSGLRGMNPMSFAAMTGVRAPMVNGLPNQTQFSQAHAPSRVHHPRMHTQNGSLQHPASYPPNTPYQTETTGSHTKALQNMMRPRNIPISSNNNVNQSNPQSSFSKQEPKTISTIYGHSNPSTSTPNLSPQSASSQASFPVTPQSDKMSPSSSSLSSSSPESSNQSPPSSIARPIVKKIDASCVPTVPMKPSIKLSSEETPYGHLFSGKSRTSAFTSVRLLKQTDCSPSTFGTNNYASDKIVAPTARRLVPLSSADSSTLSQKNEPIYSINSLMNANSKDLQTESSKLSVFQHPVDRSSSETFHTESLSRKRSLDSILEEGDNKKYVKLEDNPASSSFPSAYIHRPSNVEHRRHSSPSFRPPQVHQEEKDMWRPW